MSETRSSTTTRRRKLNPYALLVMLSVIALTWVWASPAPVPRCLSAATDLDDFCFRTSVAVTKSSTGNLTAYPVAVEVTSYNWVAVGTLNQYGWDMLPVDASGAEIDGMLQDMAETDTSPSTWWFISDVAGDGATTNLQLYTGSVSVQRDQQMYFDDQCGNLGSCNPDKLTITDHANLRQTDDFDVVVDIATSTAAQTGLLVDKFNGLSGYELGTTTTPVNSIYFKIGTGSAVTSVTSTWDGGYETVRGRFSSGAGNDLFLYYYNYTTNTWTTRTQRNTGVGSIASTTDDLAIGEGFVGGLHGVELWNNVGASNYGKIFDFEFDAEDITQTQEGTAANSWVWQGTVTDIDDTAGPHNGTYEFVRDQSMLDTDLKATSYQFSDAATVATDAVSDIFGDIGSGNFAVTPTNPNWQSLGIFGDALDNAVDSSPVAVTSFMFMITLIISLVIAVVAWFITGKNETVFAITLIVCFGLSAGVGIIPRWWGVLTGFVILAGWLLSSRVRSGGQAT